MRPVVVLAVVLLVGGCAEQTNLNTATGTIDVSNPPPTAIRGAEATDAPAETDAPAATFSPITLEGKGKKVAKFKIPDGVAAIETATHTGSSNFAVTSIAADGSQNDLLVNTIGIYKGTVLFDVDAGEHSVAFKVEADGSWTIVIKPVTSASAWNGTSVLKGAGDDVVRISPASSGLVTLDLEFKGQGNFAVESYSDDGGSLLANEVDNFKGHVLLPSGSFLLSVTADLGTWSATPG